MFHLENRAAIQKSKKKEEEEVGCSRNWPEVCLGREERADSWASKMPGLESWVVA